MTGWTRFAVLVMVAGLACGPALAQDGTGSLLGRSVVFNVNTWDDPHAPYLVSRDYAAKVADGPEFGMTPEGGLALDVVPVLVDIGKDRIDLAYPGQMPGAFMYAAFNGYVLRFAGECTLITGAAIDTDATTLPLTDADLVITPQSLGVNVAGQSYDKHSRIGVHVTVADCPVS